MAKTTQRPMRIVARATYNKSCYLVGNGEPDDPIQLCHVANVAEGRQYKDAPFAQHLKWADFIPVKQNPKLLKLLLAFPKVDHY